MKRIFIEDVKPLSYDQLTERRRCIDYEHLKYYINRMPKDIYIKDRSGLLTKISCRLKSSAFTVDHFHICDQVQCIPDVHDSYTYQARQTSPTMRQHMQKVVLRNWSSESPVSSRYSVEAMSSLSLTTLLDNDGIVYLEEHDIVVMYGLTEREATSIHHPYTLVGYATKSFEQINDKFIRKGDFTFNIRIVDNHNTFGSHWILIEDQAYCIVACSDNEVTDGIYVTYSKNLLSGNGPCKLFTDRFDFNDGEKLPIYKLYATEQEALLGRRDVQIEEAKVKLAEIDAKRKTAENNYQKTLQEKENLEREAVLRFVKHKQEMDKLVKENERMQREHELYLHKQSGEISSVNRKNTAEIIKYVPAMITAITCAVAMFKKK